MIFLIHEMISVTVTEITEIFELKFIMYIIMIEHFFHEFSILKTTQKRLRYVKEFERFEFENNFSNTFDIKDGDIIKNCWTQNIISTKKTFTRHEKFDDRSNEMSDFSKWIDWSWNTRMRNIENIVELWIAKSIETIRYIKTRFDELLTDIALKTKVKKSSRFDNIYYFCSMIISIQVKCRRLLSRINFHSSSCVMQGKVRRIQWINCSSAFSIINSFQKQSQ